MRVYMNPINHGLSHVVDKLALLEFTGVNRIPSIITAIVLFFVGAVFLVLWPFGLIAVVENMLRELISEAYREMEPVPMIEKTSYVMAMGMYVLIWFPFWLLNLPFLIFGGIGSFLNRE